MFGTLYFYKEDESNIWRIPLTGSPAYSYINSENGVVWRECNASKAALMTDLKNSHWPRFEAKELKAMLPAYCSKLFP